ncbi:MAG TPA: DUF6683 family protein [Candidatus Angelobacter sp.]|nr:DUF6683 family protein [Candidatus Angelobacter sp.]
MRAASGAGVCLLLTMLLGSAVTARAQYGDSMAIPWNNPVSATLSTNIWNNWTIYQLQQRKAAREGRSGSTDRPSPAPTPVRERAHESTLLFHSTGTHLLTNTLADQLGKTPEQKAQVTAVVEALFQEFDKQAARLGKPNDLALALSYFLAQNATVYHGTPDPQDEQFLDLRESIVAAFAQSGGFTDLSDRQKQELYEMLVSYTGLVYVGYLDAKRRGDHETMETYRHLAGMNLKNITHIEPRRIRLTAQGLTIAAE